MARTSKTTTTNNLEKTEALTEAAKVETVSEDVKKVDEPKAEVKKAREYKDSDPIPCMSITAGELGHIGLKTRINYTWAGRGDTTDVEYQDLVAAIRSGKNCIFKPYFIIMDDEFVDKFPNVKKVYDSMYSVNDLESIFELSPTRMKEVIMTLPDGAKNSIRNIASSKIMNGTLDSVKKIKILDEIFDTKLMLMTELFD